MGKAFTPLESDKDILSFDGNTYIIRKFKELINQEIIGKLHTNSSYNGNKIINIFNVMYLDHNPNGIPIQNMAWNSCMKYSLLKIGSPGWQSGELRINVSISFSKYQQKSRRNLHIEPEILLEFLDYRFIGDELTLDHVYENMQAC